MASEEAIGRIRSCGLPVLICGAGVVGQELLSICRGAGIRVESFCDNSEKVAQSGFCGLEVIHTSKLGEKYKDALFIISAAAIKDAVDRLKEVGYANWIAGGELLKDVDTIQSRADAALEYTKFAIDNCIICHDGYLNPERLFVRSIDLIITERCSLKCKDCSNLMQYYERPQNVDTGTLLRSIAAFCDVVDEIMDFRVIGGEAFMNKDWPVVVERLVAEPKARRVVLYSNGTILPRQEQLGALLSEKVMVIVTNYGALSRKLGEFVSLLAKQHVRYHVLEVDSWLDCATVSPHGRGGEGNREVFKRCCAKNMATLSDGKVFRCPYAANAMRLRAAPNVADDYVDLFAAGEGPHSLRAVKARLASYLRDKEYLETCDFCSGRPLSGDEVAPAVQVKNALAYRKYEGFGEPGGVE